MKLTSRRTLTRTASSFAAVALLVPVLLAGCGKDDDSSATTTTAKASSSQPKVADVWARPGTAGGNSAMYMTITGGSKEDQLTKVTIASDIVGTVELHETTTSRSSTTTMAGDSMAGDSTTTTMAGAMMGMQPVREITIPAGGTVTLAPGGYHVMLTDLKKDLKAGDTIPATLTLSSGDVDVTASVRAS